LLICGTEIPVCLWIPSNITLPLNFFVFLTKSSYNSDVGDSFFSNLTNLNDDGDNDDDDDNDDSGGIVGSDDGFDHDDDNLLFEK